MITPKPSARQAIERINAWYHRLDPRLAIYLTDPNVVLTLADARGQTEFYITKPMPSDAADLANLNKITSKAGIRFHTESYTSPTTQMPAIMVDVENIAGYQLVSEATKLPGIPRFDAAAGWDGIEPWQRAAVDGINAAASQGEYPPEVLEESKDRHTVMGVMKGYPDEAIMAMIREVAPKGDEPVVRSHTRIPYADYYHCAQPGYMYDAQDEAIIAKHAAAWGKILQDYYESPEHKRLAADPEFKEARLSAD